MDAVAPAKAILSGEHAVVYGAPALAVAVPRYARCRVLPSGGDQLILDLPDLALRRQLSVDALAPLAASCYSRYEAFVAGTAPVADILGEEGDLLLCALTALCGDNLSLLGGLEITLQSTIPPGSGMGSSAATVAAQLQAVAATLGLSLTAGTLVELTRAAETLQHGHSSGIDPAICCAGGAIRYRQGVLEPLSLTLDAHWSLADSGRPAVSTGVCCEQVKRGFGRSAIWSEFAAVTQTLERALHIGDPESIIAALRENHRLLCAIGVVPAPVQAWIAGVERSGGAAKVSGAGATRGEGGGLLLVYHPQGLAGGEDERFQLTPMEIDTHGARIRD